MTETPIRQSKIPGVSCKQVSNIGCDETYPVFPIFLIHLVIGIVVTKGQFVFLDMFMEHITTLKNKHINVILNKTRLNFVTTFLLTPKLQ